ncbi:E3 ubiquitin-protein ligase RNF220-like [Atheta coriaria]|uniref:E3 ubiquitin-protein ligase RNF220-like n=1 Tax=Dalotia coriaria TaxID=877792 RepID=UPI0031F43758
MENSAYVPNASHLSSPALVVFSQAASGLQDALRIQRPFNPQFQMSDATKDLHRPFSVSNFGLRHMEAYGALPAHILNHLQPQFLHPGLSLGSGAFRPIADLKAFPSPSAFAPPKCLKIETGGDGHGGVHSQGGGGVGHGSIFSPTDERFLGPSPRTDSCSPASASMSPQPQSLVSGVKEESMDAQMSEDGDGGSHGRATDTDSPIMHDDGRFRLGPLFGGGFANSYAFSIPGLQSAAAAAHGLKSGFLFDHDIATGKKKRDPSSCPVCGLTIPPGDLETHFVHELERLYKINGSAAAASRNKRSHDATRPPALPGDAGPDGRWETFQRIKTNRQGRLRVKLRKRKADDCLQCDDAHAQHCRKGFHTDEDEPVDVEGDSEFEEWAEGQRRRTHSLLTRHARFAPSSTAEGDVIVDGDDPEESAFGPSQYTESDVVVQETSPKPKEPDTPVQSQVATVNSSGDVEVKTEAGHQQQCDSNVSTSDAEPSSRAQMIEELRNRIRQLETEGGGGGGGGGDDSHPKDTDDYKCLICLEHYKKPVISTVCWHVHCEECWLHTLGSKKVCPQCSMITSPTDLRRIFM